MTETTIKVPTTVRDRVREHAHRTRRTQASVLEHALDLLDREAFFAQLAQDIEGDPETPEERLERDEWLADVGDEG
jgi:predicted transcriptional regulator